MYTNNAAADPYINIKPKMDIGLWGMYANKYKSCNSVLTNGNSPDSVTCVKFSKNTLGQSQ